jgi:hypothetical protein
MRYFSLTYIKKNWMMFAVIFIVVGGVIYLMLARGGGGGGGVVVQQSTAADPVATQAQTQLALAQIQAGMSVNQAQAELAALGIQSDTQLQLAALEAQLRQNENAASERLGVLAIQSQLDSMDMQLQNALQMQIANNQFQVDYASLAYDAAVEQSNINAELQLAMSKDQLAAYQSGLAANSFLASLSVIPSLKKKDRDNALVALTGGDYRFYGNNPGSPLANAIVNNSTPVPTNAGA